MHLQYYQDFGAPLESKPLSSAGLHYLAMACMLLDHIQASLAPSHIWLVFIGRLAFPIFAFLLVEGFFHTKDIKQYILRLAGFAILSEIPFNLMNSQKLFDPQHQNVLFTLLLGLTTIIAIENVKNKKKIEKKALWGLIAFAACLSASILSTDYGGMGVMTCVVFYLFREMPFAWAFQLIAMFGLNQLYYNGPYFIVNLSEQAIHIQVQSIAILALIPIWLYNGKKGRGGMVSQYGMYAFYPGHLLVLYLLAQTLLS